MTSTQLMIGIKTMFDMKGISVNQKWLRETIANNLKEDDLFGKVYTEYLNSDLKHSGNRSIKPIIERKGVSVDCKEIFAVQIQYLFEINTMPSLQLRRLRLETLHWGDNAEYNEETFDDIKARRFHLILSDGTDTVTAIEATPIPELNTQLAPGTKLLLEGPMRFISNLLYLESRNVKVLGGCVKEIAISNCYENILLRSLDCAKTDLPRTYQESGLRRETPIRNKETVKVNSSGDSLATTVKEVDGNKAENNKIKSDNGVPSGHKVANAIKKNTDKASQVSPHFTGFDMADNHGNDISALKSNFTNTLNLTRKIGEELSSKHGEKRSSKRLYTRYLAEPTLYKNKNSGNGNIVLHKHTDSHPDQPLKLTKSNDVSVKNESTDKTPEKQFRDGSKVTAIEASGVNESDVRLKDQSSNLLKEVVATELHPKLSLPTEQRTEQNEKHEIIENVGLVKKPTESHSTKPSNSSTEMDSEQSIKNEINVTELIKPAVNGSKTDHPKPIDRTKSNLKNTANSADYPDKSHHGSTDKMKQRPDKRKSDEGFESLYNDMKKKRNKLYDEKKIVIEAFRQKTEMAGKILQQEINKREEMLKQANVEKARLEDELKAGRNREEESLETEECQLRAQLEAQLVATTTVNNLLQQQMDNARRYLKSSGKVSTVENDSTSQVENTMSESMTSQQPKAPLRQIKKALRRKDASKPYKCDYCDKRYLRLDTRSKHYDAHHKEETKICKKSDLVD